MNKWLEIFLGLIFVIIPIILAVLVWPSWWTVSLAVLEGGIFLGLVGLGALFILLGISDIKG